ncbi:MAG: helix-turn-helix domain-containing protein [Gemmobacter sp.]|uniref:helix-turn-helix domain-containing protein n=1 Tax=Gemmobacter sp. TaxID=1898957 RepID=UPI003919EB62
MPLNALTGTRIRERRAQAGLRQTDLARAAGVSASYLNLIEHNRRKVAGEVLVRIAAALGVSVQALSGDGEADVVAALREAAAAAALPVEADRAEEFAGRFPGWAALVAAQHRRLVQLETTVEALSDRMTQDPHLSASLHELLSAAASVRSTAAILADTPDIEPEWRQRFQRNLAEDSARLARGAEALVGYLDGVAAPETGIAAPQEEFEAWASAQGWHLPALEAGADPETLLLGAAELASHAARELARNWLEIYARDAQALPLEAMQAAVAELGPHPWRLAQRFGVDPAAVLRRLAVLPGIVAGLVVCDGSGTLIFRKPVVAFPLPRFGAACPLWPLYDALQRPGQPLRVSVTMAGRQVAGFDTWAWCAAHYPAGFEAPAVLRAQMLILPSPADQAGARAVGTSCRICPRAGCPARREPPIMAEGA